MHGLTHTTVMFLILSFPTFLLAIVESHVLENVSPGAAGWVLRP